MPNQFALEQIELVGGPGCLQPWAPEEAGGYREIEPGVPVIVETGSEATRSRSELP